MRIRLFAALAIALVLSTATAAQDTGSAPPDGQNPGMGPGGYGPHGGPGGMGMMGRGLMGDVTEVAADRYTIKTFTGDTCTVRFGADTRFVKQAAGTRGQGGNRGEGGGMGQGSGMGQGRGNPPQQIKPSEIKVGDAVEILGDADASAKSVTARAIVLMAPERAKQMRALAADFGKTWLMGKITSIDGATIVLTGSLDNAPHTVIADENTQFRVRREPATLADIQVGDTIRVEGSLKDGVFTAASVNAGGRTGGAAPSVPRNAPPQY